MATAVSTPANAEAPETRAGLVGIALLDGRGDWELVDAGMCELLGHPRERLLSTPLSVLLNPDDLARERVRLEQLLAGGLLSYRSETRLLHADGQAVWAVLEATAVIDSGGRSRCLIQLQDITARRRLDTGGTGWALDADDLDRDGVAVAVKDLGGRYLRVNQAFERLFSVDGDRLSGRPDEYLFPQGVAVVLRTGDFEALRAESEPVERPETIPLADGDHELTTLRFGLLGGTGRPHGVCVVLADTSARAAAAEQAARLLERERAAREAARDARAALLEAEAERRAGAATACRRLLEGADAGSEPLAVELPFAPEPDGDEHRRLRVFEQEATAELEQLRGQLTKRMHDLERERADRAEADAEVERLRRSLAQHAREVEAERAPRAELEREVECLRAELHQRQQSLERERDARTAVEAERDRLRAAERATGERVPLPALSVESEAPAGEAPVELGTWYAGGQARLTWGLAEASTAYEGARVALAAVGETLGWAAAACYAPEGARGALRCCAFWQAPATGADDLETLSWGASFAPADLVGRAMETGQPEWVEDVADAVGFARRRAVQEAGLGTVVMVPIASREVTLGVVELFAPRRARDEGMLELLLTIGLQLGQFFMRSEAESLRSRFGLIGR